MGGPEGVDTVHAVESRDKGMMGLTDDVDVGAGDLTGVVVVEDCLVGVKVDLLLGAGTEGCGFAGGVRKLALESAVLTK